MDIVDEFEQLDTRPTIPRAYGGKIRTLPRAATEVSMVLISGAKFFATAFQITENGGAARKGDAFLDARPRFCVSCGLVIG